MNDAFSNKLSQGLLSRRDKITSILQNLEVHKLEIRLKALAHEEKPGLSPMSMVDLLDDWYHTELIHVDNALARTDNGNFGICVGCGSEIEPTWLDRFPEAEFCRSCEDLKKWIELG